MSLVARSLILDLDGTLIDSKAVILECFGKAVEAVFPGRVFDGGCVRLGPPIRQMFQIAFPAATETEVDELLRTFRNHYDLEGPIKTPAYDGARTVLAHCQSRGIGLYVATNKPWRISKAILVHLKLDHFFRAMAASDSVQPPFAGKGEMVRHLLQAGHLMPAETWYVGDSPEDAAAAASCGLPFVWAAYGYGRLGEAERKSVFRTIHALVELTELLP
jgi:phosphoglycolate phosphatase-like HAD superfamily hydrolase